MSISCVFGVSDVHQVHGFHVALLNHVTSFRIGRCALLITFIGFSDGLVQIGK